jgi:uncharacterized protein (TIGR02757 family)
MELMDDSPYDFIVHASDNEKKRVGSFVYRTFQAVDCLYFIESLQHIYLTCGGLEQVFLEGYFPELSIKKAIGHFRSLFFSLPHLPRTEKHLSDPFSGSAAKRLNLFLRWMVRADNQGVDFGIWKNISPSKLLCPLDIHSGRVARKLGLLERTTDDWRAVEELTSNLRKFDATDPVKYDFALFGSGVHGNIPCF